MKKEIKYEIIKKEEFKNIDDFELDNILSVYKETVGRICRLNILLGIEKNKSEYEKIIFVNNILKLYWKKFLYENYEEKKFIVIAREYIENNKAGNIGIARFINSKETNYKWLIEGVEVIKERRKIGVAQNIIRKGIEVIKSDNYEYVYANIKKDNYKSIRLHKKIGFIETEKAAKDSFGQLNNEAMRYEIKL